MRRSCLILLLLLFLCGCSSYRVWKRQEVVDWYVKGDSSIGSVMYRGSDARYHYFIARVFDEWEFIQIARDELSLPDEHAYSDASGAPFSYYTVDPGNGFRKITFEKKMIPKK